MSVVSLAEFKNRDTKELLASLTVVADQMGGSVMAVYRSPDGWEKVVASGVFRADATKALMAAVRLSMALTREDGALRG